MPPDALHDLCQSLHRRLRGTMVVLPCHAAGFDLMRAAAIVPEKRRLGWIGARYALNSLSPGLDWSNLKFPHPRVSMSHTRDFAGAMVADEDGFAGIGLDLQRLRPLREGLDRHFVDDEELDILGDDIPLLKAWVMKEAAFKAWPQNPSRVLSDLRVVSPNEIQSPNGDRIEVRTALYKDALWMAVALCY